MRTRTGQIISSIFFLLILCPIFPASGYWDYDDMDCLTEHGVTEFICPKLNSSTFVLDGVRNESVWEERAGNNVVIPVAARNNSAFLFVSYVNFTIFHDGDFIYFSSIWNDSTPGGLQDMFSVCWNINTTNYSVEMFVLGMKTGEPNTFVDSWGWVCQGKENGTANRGKDQSFGETGWTSSQTTEPQDLNFAFTYLTIDEVHYYSVELKRRLVTDDPLDVQFDVDGGEYLTSFAVINEMGDEDHAISWNYKMHLYLTEPTFDDDDDDDDTNGDLEDIDGYLVPVFFSISCIAVILRLKRFSSHRLRTD
jgi:hypothetical protein